MKALIKILFIGLITVLLSMAARAGGRDEWKPFSAKDKNLFVLKAGPRLIGAKIEIVNMKGNVVAEQVLSRKKLIIDFEDVQHGTYTIRVVKGSEVKEYHYSKR